MSRKKTIPTSLDQNSLFNAVFDSSPAGIVLTDSKQRILRVNDRFCKFFGYTPNELLEKRFTDLKHGEDIEWDHFIHQNLMDDQYAPSGALKKFVHKAGYTFWGVAKVIPVKGNEQPPLYFIFQIELPNSAPSMPNGSGLDQEFFSLFDQNPDPVFSMDLQGNFTHVNEATALLAECSQEELLSRNFASFCDPDDLIRILNRFAEAKKGVSFHFETGIITTRGNHRYLKVSNMPIVIHGAIAGIFCMVKDVTQRKLHEQEIALSHRIGKILNSQLSLEESFYYTVEELCHYINLSVAEVWMPGSNFNEASLFVSFMENSPVPVKINLSMTEGPIAKAMKKGQPVFLDDIQSSEEFNRKAFAKEFGLYAIIAIPLIYKNEVIAILAFYTKKPEEKSKVFHLGENLLIQLAGDVQRKKTEEEVNRFFNFSADMLCILGRKGYFKKINPAFSKILGFSMESIITQPYNTFIHPQDLAFVNTQIKSIAETHPTVQFENRFITENGQIIWVAWTFTSLTNDGLMYGVGREISQAKKMALAIQSERRRFSDMFSKAPVMMCILIGEDLVFESANDVYYKFSGRKDIIGKSVRDVFPEAEGQGIFELMVQVYQTGEIYCVNERFLQLDIQGNGVMENFYISFMFQPYRDEEGEVKGIFFFGVDVTEQVTARKVVEDSRKQYLDLIQNLPVAIYTVNSKGEILLYNKAAIVLWGREPQIKKEKWCGSWKIQNTEGSVIPHALSPMAIALREARPIQSEEIVIRRPDESIRYVVAFPSPVFDTGGSLSGGINVLADITDRKEAEEALKKLSLIAQKTINAVIITNAKGDIEWVNEAFTKITEFEFAEVVGKKASILHGPKTNPVTVKFMSERVRRQESFECEILKYTKSKKPVWIKSEGQPIFDNNGKLIHYFDIETDISEQKHAYQKLVKTEKEIRTFARQLNAVLEDERSRIAREIHDEFGQQLTGLKMSLSSLRNMDLPPRALEILNDALTDVKNSIKSLRHISTELRPGILDTLGLIPSLEWLAREFEKKTGINCLVEISADQPPVKKDIAIVFFRVCQEALTNISKHAEAKEVKIQIQQKSNKLTLKISDNGKGIKNEKLEDPFSMGLIGMRERARLIGAQVKINSSKTGTTVQLISNIHE